MKVLSLLTVVPLALAAVIQPRDGTTVNNDITGINTAVEKLNAALTSYTGGILESQPVFDATIDIHYINRKGFADANASGPFTEAQSKEIVANVNDSVGKSIPESVTLLEAKKPLFDAADLTSVVEATILLLKSDHETFSGAVGAKLSSDEVAPALVATSKIDAVLQKAALYYAA